MLSTFDGSFAFGLCRSLIVYLSFICRLFVCHSFFCRVCSLFICLQLIRASFVRSPFIRSQFVHLLFVHVRLPFVCVRSPFFHLCLTLFAVRSCSFCHSCLLFMFVLRTMRAFCVSCASLCAKTWELLCNFHISLQFSYQFAIFISVFNSHFLVYRLVAARQ